MEYSKPVQRNLCDCVEQFFLFLTKAFRAKELPGVLAPIAVEIFFPAQAPEKNCNGKRVRFRKEEQTSVLPKTTLFSEIEGVFILTWLLILLIFTQNFYPK